METAAPPLAPGWHTRPVKNAILLTVVILPLIGTALAVVLLWNRLVSWRDLAIFTGMYLATGIGITIGYHRMLTHRGFDAPGPVRFVFLALGSMALEGPAIEWAATHAKHHAKSDHEGDPHSPVEGFWHAHVGWLFRDRFIVDGVYAQRFWKDPVTVFVHKTFWLWAVLSFVIPFALGGWTGLLWGGLVRVAVLHHVTWSVNSVCHTFGSRPNATKDLSRNQWTVGLLAFGEGWHNNHHAVPNSALHGWRWWQFDGSGYLIVALEKLGLARNVVRPPAQPLHAPSAPSAPPVAADEARA